MSSVAENNNDLQEKTPGPDVELPNGDGDTNVNSHPKELAPQASLPRTLKGASWIALVVAVLLPFFLFALDNTVVADVQPRVVQTLGHVEKLPWISVAFALGCVSVNLIWGKMYGQFNTKYLFLGSVLVFEVGSVVCGAAPTMNALIVGRTICGLGGSGIYLGCMNILSILTTEAERPAYLSLVALMWGLGTVLGPIIGGAFTDSPATWRWAFYINLCVGGAIAPILMFLLPSYDPRSRDKIMARLKDVDFIGAILIIGAFVSLLMAISFGGVIFAWSSGRSIGLFVCTIVLWGLFTVQQIMCIGTDKTRRLFPCELVRVKELVILFISTASAMSGCMLPIYFLPLYFQFALGNSALEAAVHLLPYVFILVITVVVNGIIMGKFGYYMPWYFSGGALLIIGSSLMFTVKLDTSIGKIYGYSIIIAVGTGCFTQASFPVAQSLVGPQQMAAANSFIGTSQVASIALSLSIANAIFLNEAENKIAAILPGVDSSSVRAAISGAGGTFFQTLTPTQKTDVLTAIVSAISNVWIIIIAAGSLTVILSLFLNKGKLFLGPPGTSPDADEQA